MQNILIFCCLLQKITRCVEMCGDVPRSVFQNPLSLHSNLKTNTIMYLKYIRHKRQWGELQRGTLYTVHLEPNEKGGYNEHLRLICNVVRTVTNRSEYYQRGDTSVMIQTKTTESYDAKKNLMY